MSVSTHHTTCRVVLVLSILLCQALRVSAGEMRGTTGILEGRIVDRETGEVLPGANVLLVGTVYGAASDAEGYYQVTNIRAGQYSVRFSMVGYATYQVNEVTILPDLRTRIDIEMEQTTIELEVVEVRAERPLIQKDLAATAYQIGELKLEKLPVATFRDVLSLQPGTTIEGNVRGGKTSEVLYLVDGMSVQDAVGGGLATNIPKSSITAMTINTGGFDAEYGNAMSGVVNVITRSGGHDHRFGIRYERDNWIPERWNQQVNRSTEFEFSAGGPVIAEKLFYFTANTVITNDTRWWQDFERFFRSPISQEFTGFGKLEYIFSPTVRLSAQGLYSIMDWKEYEYSWRFNLAGLPPGAKRSGRGALILSHTLSDDSYYTVSASAFYNGTKYGSGRKDELSLQPYEYDFFLRYIVNGQKNWWADSHQLTYTLKGDYTHQFAKKHLVKVGFELNQHDIESDIVKYEPQTTYFGKPIVTEPLLNYSNAYRYRPRSGSVFLQDKIEIVRDGSIVSLGLRWDFLDPGAERPIVEFIPTSPDEFDQQITGWAPASFKQQISPRISVTAPIGYSSFLFVNFGHYFQFPLFHTLYAGINPSQLRSGSKNVLTGNPDLEPERTVAWELGLKHGLSENVLLSLTYFRKNFLNQIDSKTLVPFDSKFAGDYGYASYVNNAEAFATGVEVVLTRERDERLTGSISYSYMVTEGLSEYVDQGLNYAQWGFPVAATPYPLSWDQRHTVKADAEIRLFWGIEADIVLLYNSPRPYTYYPTRDGFTPVDTSKVFVPNNARMTDVTIVNAKFSKRIPIGSATSASMTVYVDARNILNARNVRWVDSSGRIGGELGDPGAYYDPRRVRLGVRFEF